MSWLSCSCFLADKSEDPNPENAPYTGICACCCCYAQSEVELAYQGEPVKQFFEKYKLLPETLGTGSFSEVRMATLLKDESQEFAVKIVKKAKLTPKDLRKVYKEVDILKALHHPNIVKCYDFYESRHYLYIVCEYIAGGELLERIEQRKQYSEEDAKNVIRTLVQALKFCYDRGVVHRDLKAENILLRSNDDDSDIVLVDFGFAYKQVPELLSFKLLQTQLGTPNYVAPEVLSGKPYNYKCDIWSLGVLTYIFWPLPRLSGQPPFYGHDAPELFYRIKQGRYEFEPERTWSAVSNSAKEFIFHLLQRDPDVRYDFDQIMRDKWLVGENSSEYDLAMSLVDLRKFNKKRRLLAMLTAAAAAKVFDEMMAGSTMSIEEAQRAENHIVITKEDLKSHEENKGEFQLSQNQQDQIDELLKEVFN